MAKPETGTNLSLKNWISGKGFSPDNFFPVSGFAMNFQVHVILVVVQCTLYSTRLIHKMSINLLFFTYTHPKNVLFALSYRIEHFPAESFG